LKVYLQIIGIPELRKIIGSDLKIDAECDTILGLIDQLCQSYGKQVKDIFFPNGQTLNMNIQVLVNNKLVLPREKLKEKIIEENDNLIFMLYIGGG
jgi:sulfur carrier protein ThiS